jgi:predicted TPR repeat methyltransferase
LPARAGEWELTRSGGGLQHFVGESSGIMTERTPTARAVLRGLAYAEDERLAAFYERHLVGDCHYQAPLWVAELIAGCARPGARWLELGAGTGLVGKALEARALPLTLVAVDISPAMLALIDSSSYSARVVADCRAGLPFEGQAFEGALACSLLEHLATTDAVWPELARVLAPGSPFIFTFAPSESGRSELFDVDQGLVSHDERALHRELEAAGLHWLSAESFPAYQNGTQGWVTCRLVRAERSR